MKYLGLIIAAILFSSCTVEPASNGDKKEINELESKIKEHLELDTAVAKKLVIAYETYVSSNPQDSISPYYLSRAADIYKEIPGKTLKSITTYNKVIQDYPEHQLAARSTFMIGFVFENKLNDSDRAIKSYTHFLTTYPDDELADDAKNLLNMLQDTLSPEEMVKMWQNQNTIENSNSNK